MNLHIDVKAEAMKRLGVFKQYGVMLVKARFETWEEYTYDKKNPVFAVLQKFIC